MKKQIAIFLIIIFVVITGFYIFEKSSKNVNTDTALIESYIRENIRSITPEKPVLGGQWYVVDIQINESDKSGTVVYEDGHIQQKASFNYEMVGNNVAVRNFSTITTPTKDVGYIAGHINIGPICPVERVDNPCVVPPEAYTSRSVVVYEADGITIKSKNSLDEKGNYYIPLPVGKYWVQIQPAGIGPGEKKSVVVILNQITTLDFDIDTGIR